jgi:hypothetical protein
VGGNPFHVILLFMFHFISLFCLCDSPMCSFALMLNSLLLAIMRYKLNQVLSFLFYSGTRYQHDFHLFDVSMDTLRTMFDLGLGGNIVGFLFILQKKKKKKKKKGILCNDVLTSLMVMLMSE